MHNESSTPTQKQPHDSIPSMGGGGCGLRCRQCSISAVGAANQPLHGTVIGGDSDSDGDGGGGGGEGDGMVLACWEWWWLLTGCGDVAVDFA